MRTGIKREERLRLKTETGTKIRTGPRVIDELTRAFHLLKSAGGADCHAAGTDVIWLDCRVLLAAAMGIETSSLRTRPYDRLEAHQLEKFDSYIGRYLEEEPVSKIIGHRAFWNDDFIVNGQVMDPRQDSETIIEAIVKDFSGFLETNRGLRVLELGVGSGCLILTVLRIFGQAQGLGIDIDTGAIAMAERNAKALGIENVKFILNDWNDGIKEKFDMVLSNPPYVRRRDIDNLEKRVRLYDPKIALDGGEDGLDCFRRIAASIRGNLEKNGMLYIEIGQGQCRDVADIFGCGGLKLLRIEKDLGGIERVLVFGVA
ncbi:MAG: peptide chain release factor N(5)-glutamine methyltransferase [Rickettsiales bacterium]|jgi:release factor glutamine methyltransferase|nr:peptide chain release factor N(5)-glutamine methyltransferase [Rickettsiales bacterium]